jgi:transposase
MIRDSTRNAIRLEREEADISKMLEELTKNSPEVQMSKQKRGIGTVTAATLVAEIVDIRRFVRENNLAGYAGPGRREHSTGDITREVASQMYNRRLKDALMTAARNYVHFYPDSHLTGYYRNLIKGGMKPMEATKRVARALVRVIFREKRENATWQAVLPAVNEVTQATRRLHPSGRRNHLRAGAARALRADEGPGAG